MSPTTITLAVLGALIVAVGMFVAWRYIATIKGGERVQLDLMEEIAPVWTRLYAGQEPDLADIARFAADRRTRTTLFDLLLFHKRLELFPDEFRTQAALAESQLVVWLMHPNELGAPPDEIELVEEVELEDCNGYRRHWFVFRFCVKPPHWAAGDGWMAGVVGPFAKRSAEVMPANVVLSNFAPFGSKSPRDHAITCRELATG